MSQFKSGDLVKLKSGRGPALTVDNTHSVKDTFQVSVVWFDKEDKMQSATLYENTLKPYDANSDFVGAIL